MWVVDDWITLGISIAGLLYYLFRNLMVNCPGWLTFYENIHAELIGIGVTVLILGNVNQYIQIRQEKRRLILQMGSPRQHLCYRGGPPVACKRLAF